MKLATFVYDGKQSFGLIIDHPHTHEPCICVPLIAQDRLLDYASRGTSSYVATKPRFWDAPPTTMMEFLRSGSDGLSRMRRFEDFMRRFLEDADSFMLRDAMHRVADVTLYAPVPTPQLIFGLVQNSPTVWRHVPSRRHLNVFPQGHQRPLGTVLGPSDPVVLPYARKIEGGWNPELGVIIGMGGRDVSVEQAMAHVAGFTVVSDVTVDYFRQDYHQQPEPRDWFEDAMTSWGDKKSDARFPMGPYLVTPDEVGNPYDLLIYTRQSGQLRDRSHTGAMHIGIERTISWLSSFRELQAGDVIHMGTMGYDGSPFPEQPLDGDVIESEIERVGILRNPVSYDNVPDKAATKQGAKRVHPAPNIRALISTPSEHIAHPEDWSVGQARHLWMLFGNYRGAALQEALPERPYPRFLCAPPSALAANGHTVVIPQRAQDLNLNVELGCVIGGIVQQASITKAENSILGFVTLAVVNDTSFVEEIVEPASEQERHLPKVYARWADGFNIASKPQPLTDWRNRLCKLALPGIGEVESNTRDYLFDATEVIAYISRYITLMPGDVIALGSLGLQLRLPRERLVTSAVAGYAEITGLPRVDFHLRPAQMVYHR